MALFEDAGNNLVVIRARTNKRFPIHAKSQKYPQITIMQGTVQAGPLTAC